MLAWAVFRYVTMEATQEQVPRQEKHVATVPSVPVSFSLSSHLTHLTLLVQCTSSILIGHIMK